MNWEHSGPMTTTGSDVTRASGGARGPGRPVEGTSGPTRAEAHRIEEPSGDQWAAGTGPREISVSPESIDWRVRS